MIKYGIIKPDEAEETAQLLHNVFMTFEPMTICNRLDPEKNLLLMRYLTAYTAEVGLTVIARDEDNGAIVGCLTHKDYVLSPSPKLPEKYYGYIDMFKFDMAMCYQLEEPIRQRDYAPGELFQPFQLAVLPEYSGMGIASEIVAHSVLLGKKLGFRSAVVECSVMGSRRAFEKNGYKLINSIPYSEFVYNGAKPYESIDGELFLLQRDLA